MNVFAESPNFYDLSDVDLQKNQARFAASLDSVMKSPMALGLICKQKFHQKRVILQTDLFILRIDPYFAALVFPCLYGK